MIGFGLCGCTLLKTQDSLAGATNRTGNLTTHPSDGFLIRLLDEEIASRFKNIERHVGSCLSCRAKLRDLQRIMRRYSELEAELYIVQRGAEESFQNRSNESPNFLNRWLPACFIASRWGRLPWETENPAHVHGLHAAIVYLRRNRNTQRGDGSFNSDSSLSKRWIMPCEDKVRSPLRL